MQYWNMAKETRTYKDRAAQSIAAVAKRRKKIKELAIQYKGGKCIICGYSKYNGALEFHHIEEKTFSLGSQGLTRSWERTKKELDKCILLCANCHREIHAKVITLPSPQTSSKML
jgi:hypothetical protein